MFPSEGLHEKGKLWGPLQNTELKLVIVALQSYELGINVLNK